MNVRLLAGRLVAFWYNNFVGRIPAEFFRRLYLRAWLGEFGESSSVQPGCRFLNGRKVYLGKRNVINFGCVFDGRTYHICTGDDVSVGPEAAILTLGHDPQSPDFTDRGGAVDIGDRVWIAYRAIILPGVTIGEGAVVAAGAVVASDVEPFTIVAGVPAKEIAKRSRELRYRLEP